MMPVFTVSAIGGLRLESNGVLESGDYNIHPAEITFVGSDDYDRYIKGGVAHV